MTSPVLDNLLTVLAHSLTPGEFRGASGNFYRHKIDLGKALNPKEEAPSLHLADQAAIIAGAVIRVIDDHLRGVESFSAFGGPDTGAFMLALALNRELARQKRNPLPIIRHLRTSKGSWSRQLVYVHPDGQLFAVDRSAFFLDMHVLALDDVISTAGTLLNTIEVMREHNLRVEHAVTTVVREPEAYTNMAAANIKLLGATSLEAVLARSRELKLLPPEE